MVSYNTGKKFLGKQFTYSLSISEFKLLSDLCYGINLVHTHAVKDIGTTEQQ